MKAKYIIIAAVIIALTGYYIASLRQKSKRGKKEKLPNNGEGIPQGWSARPLSIQLHDWLYCLWCITNEKITTLVLSLTPDQFAAVINDYNEYYEADLIKDLQDDLSGTDLAAVMALYQRI